MKRSLLFAALLSACAPVDDTPQPYACVVEDAAQREQAIIKLLPVLTFALPAELGGLTCAPDGSEACAQQLEEQCIAQLVAVVGVPVTTSIGLVNSSQLTTRIDRIALTGDCASAWQLDSAPEEVAPGATAQVALTFVGARVGTCTARFEITSDAGNFVDGTARVTLSATVTE